MNSTVRSKDCFFSKEFFCVSFALNLFCTAIGIVVGMIKTPENEKQGMINGVLIAQTAFVIAFMCMLTNHYCCSQPEEESSLLIDETENSNCLARGRELLGTFFSRHNQYESKLPIPINEEDQAI